MASKQAAMDTDRRSGARAARRLFLIALLCLTAKPLLASETKCDPKNALIFAGLANTASNNDTRSDSEKALRYAKAAYLQHAACIKAAISIKELAAYHLAAAHNLAIAALAADNLGKDAAASEFAHDALKMWHSIVSTKEYPSDIRAAAQRELDAAEK